VHEDPPIILPSASRHAITEPDMLHAWALAVDAYDLGDGLVMFIGPDRAGNILEVGLVEWYGTIAIAHAMRARPRFLR
jgi:hypothetical protein